MRNLKIDEIEVRVGGGNNNGFSLLLYKNARVDSKILDEEFGTFNWKNDFELIDGQLFASISIWDTPKQQWITKKDVGIESQQEKEKGRASDAFKRAGFKWQIGSELYNAPFIWIDNKLPNTNFFTIKELEINQNGKFIKLVIYNKDVEIWSLTQKVVSKETVNNNTPPPQPTSTPTNKEKEKQPTQPNIEKKDENITTKKVSTGSTLADVLAKVRAKEGK